MKTLEQLVKEYTRGFRIICKRINNDGMAEWFAQYTKLKELCVELSIDTEEIENKFINKQKM